MRKAIQWCALAVVLSGLLIGATGSAKAGLVTIADRTTLNAAGTIAYNSNFSDMPGGSNLGFSLPGDLFTRGDVTYTTDLNLVVGPTSSFAPIVALMAYNYWSPLTATINTAPKYDLLGFDAGVLGRQDKITVEITTNLATYTYPLLTLANAASSLTFLGFRTTDASEYFTGFSLTNQFGEGSLPGITNVAVGNQPVVNPAVPEPSSIVLFGVAGLIGLGYTRRRCKSKLAA